MEVLLLGALVAFVLLVIFLIWLTVSLLGLIVTLVVAGLVGWLADRLVPGDLPYGVLGAVAAGLVGSWVGGAVLGDLGPSIGGIALIPAFVGAAALAAIIELVAKARD